VDLRGALMTLTELTDNEIAIVGQCLRAAVEGPFFPDWEFQTLIGVSREEVRQLATRWSSGVMDAGATPDTVVAVLNNLLGYPHGYASAWSSFIRVPPAEVATVLQKVRSGEQTG